MKAQSEPCIICNGELEQMPSQPVGEGHVSVDFGPQRFRVFLNGLDVSAECPEAFAGADGWAVLFPGKQLCASGRRHVYTVRRTGAVAIKSRRYGLGRP